VVARTLSYDLARTLPVAIATLQPQTGEWHFSTVTAAYMLMFAPPFLVMALVQRWFIRGLTEGGKGSVLLQVQSLADMGAPVKKQLPASLVADADAGVEPEDS
jgi:hypothetical protein